MLPEMKIVYTLEEVSKLVGVTNRTLYKHIKIGRLKAVRIGRGWKVTAEELQRYLNTPATVGAEQGH